MPNITCFCAGSRVVPVAFVFAALLFSSSVSAGGYSGSYHWSAADSKRQWMYLSAHSMDWLQTRYIAAHPEQYYETNPMLGENPSQNKVDAYFLGTALLHSGIAYVLPASYRKWFQYSTLVMETGYVGHNISLGIGFQF